VSKKRKVFVYFQMKKWGREVLSLLDGLVTPAVIEKLTSENSDSFYGDNGEWLDSAIRSADPGKDIDESSFQFLASRFRERYTHIRVFHGCRPVDVGEYYQRGFLPMDPEQLIETARRYFLRGQLKEINEGLLEKAIAEISTKHRANHIYFVLDDRHLLNGAGEYLIYGSEYLYCLAIRLTGNCESILRKMGIPTIFACDLPVEMVDSWAIDELVGHLLSTLFRSFESGEKKTAPKTRFSFWIKRALPSEFIHSHYHPSHIRDSHNYHIVHESIETSCPFCKRPQEHIQKNQGRQ